MTTRSIATHNCLRLMILQLLLLPMALNAQVSFGINGGPLLAEMIFYDTPEVVSLKPSTKERTGFGFGLMLAVPLGEHLVLQPELAYRQKGYRVGPPGFAEDQFRWLFDYLDLSLILRYHPLGRDQGLHILAGPHFSRLLGMRVRDNNTPAFMQQYPLEWQTHPVAAADPDWLGFSLFDAGVTAGVGHQIRSGGTRLVIDVRYQRGFMNIHNGFRQLDVNGALIGRLNSRNWVIMANVGWLIPLPGRSTIPPVTP